MFYPMLCESHPATDEAVRQLNGTYLFERKYDGIRAIIAINNGTVNIYNRNAVDISHRYPEIVKAGLIYNDYVGGARLILDGEILCGDDSGTDYDFAAVHRRDAQSDPRRIRDLSRITPALFMAFDVLYDGTDLRKLSLEARREHLETLVQDLSDSTYGDITTSTSTWQDGEAALAEAIKHGYEGIVAKRLNSTYSSGRSSAWKKIKPTRTGSFIVLGLEPGNGSRADTFGALHIGVKTPDGFEAVGKVGSGFTEADLRTIQTLWEGVLAGQTPPPVIEVEFQEITDKGSLRFPVFKGIRTDVIVDDCTRERQLA